MTDAELEKSEWMAARLASFAARIEGDRRNGFCRIPASASFITLKNGHRIDIRGLMNESSIFLIACMACCIDANAIGMTRSDMAWWKPERVSRAYRSVKDYVTIERIRINGKMAGSRYVIRPELMAITKKMMKASRDLSPEALFSTAIGAERSTEFVSKSKRLDNAIDYMREQDGNDDRVEDLNSSFLLSDIVAYSGLMLTASVLTLCSESRCSEFRSACRKMRQLTVDYNREFTRVSGFEYAKITKDKASEFVSSHRNDWFITRCCVSNDINRKFIGGIPYQDIIETAHVARYVLVYSVELDINFQKKYPEIASIGKSKPYFAIVKDIVRQLSAVIGKFSIDKDAESTPTSNAYKVIKNKFKLTDFENE